MNNILALDLGTTTGWALLHQGKITSGSKNFKPKMYEGAGMRFLRFRQDFLQNFLSFPERLQQVYFEQVVSHGKDGTNAAHIYGGLMATLMAFCEQYSIPYSGVPVGTIKKHITGKGNAGKEAVIAAVRAQGFAPADDNEADALALLDYVNKKLCC